MSAITTKKELSFYIQADLMMNRGVFKRPLPQRIKELLFPDPIMRFLRVMRTLSYYSNTKNTPPSCERYICKDIIDYQCN